VSSRVLRLAATVAVAALVAAPVDAHLVQTGFGSFYDGVAHPLVTLEDLLLVLGLGLLAGLRGKPESRALLLALPAAWLLGGVAGAVAAGTVEMPLATAATFCLVGLLVAANARVSRGVLCGIAATAGGLHGFVNGATLAPEGGRALALTGVALTVFALVTLCSALVVGLRAEWTRIAVRVAGSWFAATGLLVIGWALRSGSP
jgi:hydrogenase/urease accessory protein HupE